MMAQTEENIIKNSKGAALDECRNNENPCHLNKAAKKKDTPFLYFTVCTAMLLMLTGGGSLVWPSPAIIALSSMDPEVNPMGRPIKAVEISMLVGLPSLISLIGGPMLPKLSDLVGRKKSLYLLALGCLLSIVLTALSKTLYLTIFSLCLTANVYNGIWGLLPIYLTEVTEDHNRAKFGCLNALCLPLGQLYCYIVGANFGYTNFTLFIALPLIPFLSLFFLAPESPVYLLKIGKTKECMETLAKLRSNKSLKEIEKDFQKIEEDIATKTDPTNFRIIKLFKSKEGKLGLFLAVLPLIVQFLSGVPLVMSLLAPIFNETGTIPGNTVAMIIGAVKVATFFLTSIVVERTGRKPLLLISSIGTGIPVTVLGVFFYLKHINSSAIEHLQFLPLTAVITYVVFYSIGLGPIPTAVMGELFPIDLRSAGIGFVTTVAVSILAIYSFSFPLLAESIGSHWLMWMFGFSCFTGALVIYFVMPETKGKSIVEIQKMLKEY